MSLWSDFEAEYAYEMDHPNGITGDMWTTKDGRVLHVKDMTTSHIRNCMKMLGGPTTSDPNDIYWAFDAELKRRTGGDCTSLSDSHSAYRNTGELDENKFTGWIAL